MSTKIVEGSLYIRWIFLHIWLRQWVFLEGHSDDWLWRPNIWQIVYYIFANVAFWRSLIMKFSMVSADLTKSLPLFQ